MKEDIIKKDLRDRMWRFGLDSRGPQQGTMVQEFIKYCRLQRLGN